MRTMILLVMSLASTLALADSKVDNYYGADFIAGHQNKTLKNDDLKNLLFNILSGGHLKNDQKPDEIVSGCGAIVGAPADPGPQEAVEKPATTQPNESPLFVYPGMPIVTAPAASQPFGSFAMPTAVPLTVNPMNAEVDASPKKCVQHTALGYEGGRRKLFGQLFLKQDSAGTYSVKDVYCEKDFTDADFKGNKTFGPDMLPISGNIINTEHTWPQSRFTGRFPKELQKSDLHHLFPTDSQMNGQRGSLHFGYVVDPEKPSPLKCPQDKFGHQENGEIVFEVPDSQKGNTARAIFYFATRYQMKVSPAEEGALRKWDKFDPVDAQEADQNNQIEALQGNRNPYIDYSDLIDSIDHF